MKRSEGLTRLLRLRKVLAGKDFYLRKDINLPTVHKGNRGASWTFYPETLKEQSIVYSFGVGLDISFDLAVIERYGSVVHAFDPTPKSIDWIAKQNDLPEKFTFYPVGIAAHDGEEQFFAPQIKDHVSHTSIEGLYHTAPIKVPVKRLSTIMAELGHDHIDLLKLDIEGSEYGVLDNLLAEKIPAQQLLVEFHHRFSNIGIKKSKDVIRKLRASGYRVFSVSPNGEEISFINRSQH